MRFMMIMIPRVYQQDTPPEFQAKEGFAPPLDAVDRMMRYNEELAKAVIVRGLDGLHPLARGARVAFTGGKPVVTEGPDIKAREVVGGYWLIEAGSLEEVVEWATRCPADEGDVIEIRQIFEFEDFSPRGSGGGGQSGCAAGD